MAKITNKSKVFNLEKTSFQSCRYDFSVEEKREIASEMAEYDARAVKY